MIRISIYFNNNPKSGGSFTYNLNIIDSLKYFDSKNYIFNIICCNQFNLPFEFQNNLPQNIHLFRFKENKFQIYFQWAYKKIGFNPIYFRKYLAFLMNDFNILKDTKADIYLFPSQDDKSYLYNLDGKIITVIHDLMHKFYPDLPEVKGSIRDFHYSNIIKFSDFIIVDSEIGKSHVSEFYNINIDNIFILPFSIYSSTNKHIKEIKELITKKFIFYPAQLWKHKNHLNLLKAIKKLKTNIPNILLVLTGSEKNMLKEINDYIKNNNLHNNIIILGFITQPELQFLYKNAVALVFPSLFGPTNLPPLEAINEGCPVLISEIFGNKEQCQNAALYFDPTSIDSIALSIKSIWNDSDLRNKLIENSIEIKNNMTSQNHYNYFFSILNKVQLTFTHN